MKVRAGRHSVKVPPIGEFGSVFWSQPTQTYSSALQRVSVDEWLRVTHPEAVHYRGRPIYFMHDAIKHRLRIWPAPAKRGTLEVYYYPPMEKL